MQRDSCVLAKGLDSGTKTRSSARQLARGRPGAGADLELLHAVLEGDQRAWARFTRRFGPVVERRVRSVLRTYGASSRAGHEVEDIAAEVWVLLLSNDSGRLRAFEPARGYRLSTWIGRIATNHTIDHLRRHRRSRSASEWRVDWQREHSKQARPDELFEHMELQRVIGAALREISAGDRRATELLLTERSTSELALELGVSANTLYLRRFKLRAKLLGLVEQLRSRRYEMLPGNAIA